MKKWKIKLAIVLISLCQGLQYTVAPVLNQISAHYAQVPTYLIQMLVTAPALASMGMALLSGWLVTRVSKKRLLIAGALIMGVMGMLPLGVDHFWMLFFSRIVLGIGMGLEMTLSTAVIAEHFEGAERGAAMGLQGASAGAGVLVASWLAAQVGGSDYRLFYYTHLLAFAFAAGLWLCLPDTGRTKLHRNEKLRVNGRVLSLCVLTLLEALLFSTFTTNIALHLEGTNQAVTVAAGNLTSLFSVTQIAAGLSLQLLSKRLGRFTLPFAVLLCGLGGAAFVYSSTEPVILAMGAILFGLSQGFYVPRAMFEASELVSAASVALASAFVTVSINIGQFLSPAVLNITAQTIGGEDGTASVFRAVALIGTGVALLAALLRLKNKHWEENQDGTEKDGALHGTARDGAGAD